MCGFVGFFGGKSTDGQLADEAMLKGMANKITHRGPDDEGYWVDVENRIGFGHRRLSIVDLSAAGHQPMTSTSGRYVMAYNGEIYNHLLIRDTLESMALAPAWRGHSDTESLLAGFDAWGIEDTVKRSIGMFSFAVWDRQTHTLTLAVDRLGEKPLYYGWQGQGNSAVFLFGSELKALRVHPAFEKIINRGALNLQLRHNYIPAPFSIYQGVAKLLPGSLLTVSLRQREPKVAKYWSGIETAKSGVANPFNATPDEAVSELEILLKDAVRQQMVADVPLGAFLSGGVDSSTVVALMQSQSMRPIKTFTIGFHASDYNEAEHAKAVARHLNTEHTELYVTPEDAMAVIPRLPALYDEPFSDSSQIPTFLVSQLARQHVTVSLSGDAGDELFCGYDRYQRAASRWNKVALVPLTVRKFVGNGISNYLSLCTDRFSKIRDKLHKGAGILKSQSADELYLSIVSHWHDPTSIVLNAPEPLTLFRGNVPDLSGLDYYQRMMALDMLTYLPGDILVKVDRAAMGVSLETRVPLLDHRVVEFAWRLPQSMKVRHGQTKWALRQILYQYVPSKLIERPKMGFGVPIGEWLRGPLRSWAESLLDETRLSQEGFFQVAPIRQKWKEHIAGVHNWQYHLWDVLMFQAWLEDQARHK